VVARAGRDDHDLPGPATILATACGSASCVEPVALPDGDQRVRNGVVLQGVCEAVDEIHPVAFRIPSVLSLAEAAPPAARRSRRAWPIERVFAGRLARQASGRVRVDALASSHV
jgi:hypothetical protein